MLNKGFLCLLVLRLGGQALNLLLCRIIGQLRKASHRDVSTVSRCLTQCLGEINEDRGEEASHEMTDAVVPGLALLLQPQLPLAHQVEALTALPHGVVIVEQGLDFLGDGCITSDLFVETDPDLVFFDVDTGTLWPGRLLWMRLMAL
ncbi:hypothetical protein [Aquabacterium sp.]|uniref:hypothetical protein n=1 Tax=Aquabacterium sp. TaxID=1872578 RepID=UPI004037A23B